MEWLDRAKDAEVEDRNQRGKLEGRRKEKKINVRLKGKIGWKIERSGSQKEDQEKVN